MSHEYFSGSPEDRAAFADQLDVLWRKGSGVMVGGSIGRAAIYAAYQHDVPPLPLIKPSANSASGTPRDIDVFVPLQFGLPRAIQRSRPHSVDSAISYVFDRQGGLSDVGHGVPLDRRVLRSVPRILDIGGRMVKVRTFGVGTLLHLQRYIAHREGEEARYATSLQVFADFAEELKPVAPQEFLEDGCYEPFYRLMQAENSHKR